MASNEIVFTVKVKKDGNLSVIAKDADKAAKGTDKLGKSTDNLEKSRNRYHKAEKGVGQAGLSSSKSFSKMRQTMGGGSSGLVGAYAVLAANIFALTAAFGALQRAAQVQQLEQGLSAMGSSSGVALKTLSEGLRAATGHALNLEDAMRATALASSAGFDSSSIERLGDVARKASIALGRDTADSLNRLTKGAIKLEPELLDELGIMVRLDEASQAYATALNKNVADLTNFEKRQGFMNAVLTEGESKFAAMGDVDTNPYDRLAATFNDLTKTVLNFLNKGIIPIIAIFANSQMAMLGGLILFGKTIASAMLPALAGLAGGYEKAAKKSQIASLQQVNQLKLFKGGTKGMQKFIKEFDPLTAKQQDFNKILNVANGQLTRNTNQLAKWADEGKKSAEVLAEKEVLIASNQRAVNEAGLANFNFARSEMAAGDGAAVAAAAQGNYREAMDKLGVQLDLYDQSAERAKKGTKGLGKAQITMGNIAAKTAVRVRVLGTAFLNMIPIIGQIIMVLGILWSVFKKVIDMMRSDEQKQYLERQSKLLSAMDEWGESLQQVSNYQQGLSSTISSVAQEMEALTNVYTSMAKGIGGLGEAELGGWDKFFNMFTDSPAEKGLKQIIKAQPELIEQVKKLALEAGVHEIAVNQMNKEYFEANTIQHRYAKVILPKLLGEVVKAPAAINTMIKSVKEANKSFDEFANATQMKTSVDSVIGGLTDIDNGMKIYGESSGEKWVEGYKQAAGDNLGKVIDIDKIMKDNTKSDGFSGTMKVDWDAIRESIKEAQGELTKKLKVQQKAERVLKSENKMLQSNSKLHKFLKGIQGSALQIAKNDEKLRENANAQLEIDIQNHIIANALTEKDEDTNEVILNLRQQQADLEKQKLTSQGEALITAKENLEIEQKSQESRKAINEGIQRGIDLHKRSMDAQETISLNEAREANRGLASNTSGSGDLSAAQKYKTTYQQLNDDGETLETLKISAIDKERVLKLDMIDMEFDLLKLRLEVIRADMLDTAAKAKLLDPSAKAANTAPIDSLINSIEGDTGLRAQTKALVELESLAALSQIEDARQEAIADVKNQLKTGGTGIGPGSSAEAAGVLKTGTGTLGKEGTGHTGEVTEEDAIEISYLDKVALFKRGTADLIESAKQLGPGGELIAAVAGGALNIADAWGVAGAAIEDGAKGMAAGAAIATAITATINQVASIMAASSKAKIAGIDDEIAAEKKRDGKSKESLAKIKGMEKKKEQEKRKAFEMNKKMQMASIIASTASAMMSAMVSATMYEKIPGALLAGMIGAMGAAQLAVVAGTSYQGGGGSISSATGPSAISMGSRNKRSDLSSSKSASGELAYFRGDKGVGGAENFRGAFYGKKHRASGGNTGYIVGEQGPELFMPDRPGTIVPSDDVSAAGGATNVSFSINAIDAAGVEEVLMEQQGNIIGMLRQAANSHGEDFFEDVDETIYSTPRAASGAQRWGS